MTSLSYPPLDGVYTYPFDPTGTAITNKIVGELQTLSPGADSDFFFIIPKAAPFFREGLQLVDNATNLPLVEGVDFLLSHKFLAASRSIGKDLYGSITILNKQRTGVLRFVSYQTVGGAWTLNDTQIAALLANTTYNPLVTTWDQIQDLPYQFPPINHDFSLDDLKGFDTLVDAVYGLADAITGTVANTSGKPEESGLDLTATTNIDIVTADGYRDYLIKLNAPSATMTLDTPTPKPGEMRVIEVTFYQEVGGSDVVWPNNVTWATGATGDAGGPALTQTMGAFDVVAFKYISSDLGWLGYIVS